MCRCPYTSATEMLLKHKRTYVAKHAAIATLYLTAVVFQHNYNIPCAQSLCYDAVSDIHCVEEMQDEQQVLIFLARSRLMLLTQALQNVQAQPSLAGPTPMAVQQLGTAQLLCRARRLSGQSHARSVKVYGQSWFAVRCVKSVCSPQVMLVALGCDSNLQLTG